MRLERPLRVVRSHSPTAEFGQKRTSRSRAFTGYRILRGRAVGNTCTTARGRFRSALVRNFERNGGSTLSHPDRSEGSQLNSSSKAQFSSSIIRSSVPSFSAEARDLRARRLVCSSSIHATALTRHLRSSTRHKSMAPWPPRGFSKANRHAGVLCIYLVIITLRSDANRSNDGVNRRNQASTASSSNTASSSIPWPMRL